MSPPDDDAPLQWMPVTEAPRGPPEDARALPMNWFGPIPEARRRRKAFDPHRPAHWLAGALALFVLGVVVLNLAVQAYVLVTDTAAEPTISGPALVVSLLFNMVLFIGVPVVWVLVMYDGGGEALRERLFLRSHHVGKDIGVGVGAGLLGLVVSYLFVVLFMQLGLQTENPVVDELSASLTWGLVFFIPFAAATSEEVFFRAWLQPRVGVVAANVFFGFVHLSYQTPLQVIVPMALGFILSWTLVRRRSILPAIVAHFVFNFVALALTKLAFDLGWDEATGWLFL